MSIAAAFAADKEIPFRAAPVTSYEHRQTNSKVTIAAEPFTTPEKIKSAFGKLNIDEWVLPVLIVVQNDSDKTIKLDRMQVEFIGPGRQKIEATPPGEVKYLFGPQKPRAVSGPTGPIPIRGKKNPLTAWEVEGRAFSAQMLPPGQSASGFYYFQTKWSGDGTVYVSGLSEAGTGTELLYFEIPLKK